MILALRTDKPEAELYLYSADYHVVDSYVWQAHRELSDTILIKIDELLHNNKLTLKDLTALAVYQGPGSFTGLRIGISVANTLSYTLNIPIAAATHDDWLIECLAKLKKPIEPAQIVVPEYGAQPTITKPRK